MIKLCKVGWHEYEFTTMELRINVTISHYVCKHCGRSKVVNEYHPWDRFLERNK